MEYTAQELYDLLNDSDECRFIEAKTTSNMSRSILEMAFIFVRELGAIDNLLYKGLLVSRPFNPFKKEAGYFSRIFESFIG
jgi:hypothetical protein